MSDLQAVGPQSPLWLTQLAQHMGLGELAAGSPGAPAAPAAGSEAARAAELAAAGGITAERRTAAGGKYSAEGAGPGSLPAPLLPYEPMTARDWQGHQAFSQEMSQAMQAAQAHAARQPELARPVRLAPGPQATVGEAATQTLQWGKQMGEGLNASIGGGLRAFMLARIQSSEQGLKGAQAMTALVSDNQSTLIQEQVKQGEEAEKAAKKAAAKAAKMGILAPLVSVAAAILAAIVTIATLGAAAGLAVIMVAAVVALAVGVGVGAKNGKGFDFNWAMNAFAIACSLGTIASPLAGAAAAASRMAQVAAQMIQAGGKTAAQTASQVWSAGGKAATAAMAAMEPYVSSGMSMAQAAWLQVATAAVTGAMQTGKAGGDMRVALLQADSKESLGVIQMLKAEVERLDGTYQSGQDVVQALTKSHQEGLEQVNRVLRSRAEVANIVRRNMT